MIAPPPPATFGSKNCNQPFVITGNESFTVTGKEIYTQIFVYVFVLKFQIEADKSITATRQKQW